MPDFWAVEWHSRNKLDGDTRHLTWEGKQPSMFRTRSECRRFINAVYGYIRTRPDLRAEPHGWFVPTAVRVRVEKKS